MAYKVLIPQDIPPEAKALLERAGGEIKMGRGRAESDLIADIPDCEALVARTVPVTRAVLEAAGKLRIISRFGVGVDNIDLAAADSLGIWVANTPQANSLSVAEHVVALMLACATDLIAAGSEMRRGNFAYRDRVMGFELAGKTLGIVGLGRIGGALAKIAGDGLSMRIIAHDPYLKPELAPPGVEMAGEWDRVFREGDFVSLHLPGGPGARKIGAREFALMKETAILVNCARGELVVEKDLLAALRSGRIGGAALDVFEKEPPDPDNPLLVLPNVVATPHDSSFTREAFRRMGEHMAKNIEEVMSGRRPAWPVNNPMAGR
ncbi:MAG: hydroxyacid dehydrogenase [Planctomycetota bacterium]|jgi:D-3-phosphoglycerate dehydrogenase|nr:hydroxyacid dehydrogenase [Planctomycetota bacterium]